MKEFEKYFNGLLNHELPEEAPIDLIQNFYEVDIEFRIKYPYFHRSYLYLIRQMGGFALMYKSWIRKLSKYLGKDKVILEVMSGNGCLAKNLSDFGLKVYPTDNKSWEIFDHTYYKPWCKIEDLGTTEAVNKYINQIDYILMSWPPYNESTAYEVLKLMKDYNKANNKDIKLIYIGEYLGGCTADDKFFELVEFEDLCSMNFGYLNINYFHDDIMIIK